MGGDINLGQYRVTDRSESPTTIRLRREDSSIGRLTAHWQAHGRTLGVRLEEGDPLDVRVDDAFALVLVRLPRPDEEDGV